MVYTISGVEFKNKSQIEDYVRSIVYKYKIGSVLDENDFNFVYALLQYHPESKLKIGNGIERIEVRKNKHCNPKMMDNFLNKRSTQGIGFLIIYKDGSAPNDFGWKRCIRFFGGTKSKEEKMLTYVMGNFKKACRTVVDYDIRKYRSTYFKNYGTNGVALCQETGEMMKYEDSDVHHFGNTFNEIVDEWINVFSADIFKIEIENENLSDIYKFVDKDIGQCFRDFHNIKARLKVVDKKIHHSGLK